jgi:hypothetical protein
MPRSFSLISTIVRDHRDQRGRCRDVGQRRKIREFSIVGSSVGPLGQERLIANVIRDLRSDSYADRDVVTDLKNHPR